MKREKSKAKEPTLDNPKVRVYLRGMSKRLTSTSKPRAIGYVRVSTGKQADKGGSLAVQRDRIVEFAVLNGYELVGVFEDAGISGAKDEGERAGFAAALDAIRNGNASTLVVADVDRLSRDSDVAGHARIEIKRAGGKVVVLSEIDANVEIVAVRQLLAVLEREKIRARMRTWSASRLAKGLHMGPAPYGLQISPDGTLEAVESEAPVVDRIVERAASGASLRTIAAELNEAGIPTRSGKAWNAMTVSGIVKRGAR